MATNYLDATQPADTEAATLGAARIRNLETQLNFLIAQIWNSSGNFLANWIIGSGNTDNPASMFSPATVGTDDIAPGAITEALLAAGALGADSTGFAIMANQFIQSFHLASGIRFPAQSVDGNALGPSAVQIALQQGTNPIGLACITPAMLTGQIGQMFIGSYTGNNGSVVVNTVPFAPNVIILFPGPATHGFGTVLQQEGTGNIHASWAISDILSPFTAAVQFSSNGFTVVPHGFQFNTNGVSHSFIALQIG